MEKQPVHPLLKKTLHILDGLNSVIESESAGSQDSDTALIMRFVCALILQGNTASITHYSHSKRDLLALDRRFERRTKRDL